MIIRIFESRDFQKKRLTLISNKNNTNAIRNMNSEYIIICQEWLKLYRKLNFINFFALI